MANYEDYRILLDLFDTIQHFGERQAVQRQLTIAALIVVGAWLLAFLVRLSVSYILRRWLHWPRAGWEEKLAAHAGCVLRRILYPGFTLIALQATRSEFLHRGWHEGLLSRFILLYWAYLLFRTGIGVLYAWLGPRVMRRYHYRFLAPLFGFLALGWFLDHLIPLSKLASIVVFEGFTSPVTLGALTIATVGFYFWLDGSGVAQDVVRAVVTPYIEEHQGTVEAFLIIGRYAMIAIGIYVVFAVLGFDSTTVAFLTGGLSVGLGFGSKEIIGNLISGVLLLFDQSLRPGDIISIDGQMGTVHDIGIRATTVRTLNNVELVVPNQSLMTSNVTTYTKTDRLVRVLIDVETADAHSPHDVRDALLTAARQHPHVEDKPEPTVFYLGSGDTSYRYKLAIWIANPLNSALIASEVYFMVYDEFTRRGIRPSTPARDLSIQSAPWDRFINVPANNSSGVHLDGEGSHS